MKILKLTIKLLIFISFVWIAFCIFTLPSLNGLGNKTRVPSISILDNSNNIIGSLGDVYGGLVELDEVPQHLIDAVIVLEDKRFFSHYGIDLRGLIRASIRNIKEMRYAEGASTITQQLSKVIFLNADKTLSRKFRELIISFYLEYKYSKNEILLMYLNRVYLGSGLYGLKAASKRYFSKHPKDLSIAESSILAGLLKSPSSLSPIRNMQGSIKRGKLVVNLLYDNRYIDLRRKNNALSDLKKIGKTKYLYSISSRYYMDWVFGSTPDEVLKYEKDLFIYTPFDYDLQNNLDKALKKRKKALEPNIEIAVAIMDLKGEVKALTGGKDWNISKFNRATQSKRQVGSVFKTFVYLTALDMGYGLEDIVLDTPILDQKWKPKNYANKYLGKISFKKAYAISSNVAAVRITDDIGRKPIIDYAKRLGIISNIIDAPSIALGASSMSLLELVGAFGAICGKGKAVIPHGIKQIQLRDGSNVWERITSDRKQIINNSTLNKIKLLMREVVLNGTASKLKDLPFNVIGKTGTSQKNRDAWFIGCAKDLVVGVWVGRDDDKSMKNIFGSNLPLIIFKDIILAI